MKRSRVVVLNPPNVPFTDDALLIEPIDVLTVATWISSLGYQVELRDLDKEKCLAASYAKELDRALVDVVVIPFDYHIPLYTAAAAQETIALIAACRDREIPVVVGGRPATRYPELFLQSGDVVVVLGEMELALQELLPLLISGESVLEVDGIAVLVNNSVVRTNRRRNVLDLNSLPIPDRSMLDIHSYIDVHSMLSSRGCVEQCSFCPVHTFWGRWRRRSAELVAREIEYLVKDCKAEKILFLDDHATANQRRMREISDLLIAQGVKVPLGCLGTAASAEKETLHHMRKAGFNWIHYGVEFGDDQVLRRLNKRSTVNTMRNAIEMTREVGIRVRASVILDSPGATEEGLSATHDLLLETEPEEVRAHFLTLRACAPLDDELRPNASGIAEQYIHSDRPHTCGHDVDPHMVTRWSDRIAESLQKRGYLKVVNPIDWEGVATASKLERNVKFISYCPGRYGLGWREAA
jgi:anaerobic magnesium-protoporphyrin IX monomethyl ester cyclase